MGYVRNPAVSQLMSYLGGKNRSATYQNTIALINPSRNEHFLQEEAALRQFEKEARARAEELGYKVEPFWYHQPKTTPKRLAAILKARGIEGIILSSAGEAGTKFEFDHDAFSFVTVGDTIVSPKLNRVMEYHFNNGSALLERLRALGYRRIGFAFSTKMQQIHALRHKAAALCYYSEIGPKERCPIFEFDEWNHAQFIKWFRRAQPEVVVSNVAGPLNAFQIEGIAMPSAVGFAQLELSSPVSHVAGMRTRFGLLGRAAIEILVGQLHRREFGVPLAPQIVKIEGVWQSGETVRSSSS